MFYFLLYFFIVFVYVNILFKAHSKIFKMLMINFINK